MQSTHTPLSPHFGLHEFTRSQLAMRQGIANRPKAEHRDNLARLCNTLLEPLREALGPVHISSGYRSPPLNMALGGARNSQHCQGLAADLLVNSTPVLAVCRWLYGSALPYDQLIFEGGWVHVSVAAAGQQPRRETLTATFLDGRVRYTPGLPGREGA